MAKISPFSSFRVEDFPSEREWIATLFLPLNNTLSQVTQTLNGQVNRVDNIPSFTKVINGSSLTLPLSFRFEGKFSPSQMMIARALRGGLPIAMIGAWSISGDTITVNKLFEITDTGNIPLSSGQSYNILLRFE